MTDSNITREQIVAVFKSMDQASFDFLVNLAIKCRQAAVLSAQDAPEEIRGTLRKGSIMVLSHTLKDVFQTQAQADEGFSRLFELFEWYRTTYGDNDGFSELMNDLMTVRGYRRGTSLAVNTALFIRKGCLPVIIIGVLALITYLILR